MRGGCWQGEAPLTRLYSTNADGYNLRTVLHNVKGYCGPSVVVAKDGAQRIYGGYASIMWEDGGATRPGNFLKDDACFLFSLVPRLEAYRARGPLEGAVPVEAGNALGPLPGTSAGR